MAGILWEHQKTGKSISYEAIDKAVTGLYDGWSITLLKAAFASGDYEALYLDSLESERTSKEILINFIRNTRAP